MDNASTQSLDLLERRIHLGNGEVGQRDRVAGPGAAFVDPDVGLSGVCLPAAAFGLTAIDELSAEQTRPEPPRAMRIIGGKLDQGERSVHSQDDNAVRVR